MPSRNSMAAFASASSILERAKPTWMRIQSPGWRSSPVSRPMLMARLTPLTLTFARSGWSTTNSTISPGIPRHISLSHRDGFEDELVAGHGDEFDGGTVGDAAGGDQLEPLRQRGLHHPVPGADPHPHAGHLAPGGPLLDGVEEGLTQPDLVHHILLIRRYRRISGIDWITRTATPASRTVIRIFLSTVIPPLSLSRSETRPAVHGRRSPRPRRRGRPAG